MCRCQGTLAKEQELGEEEGKRMVYIKIVKTNSTTQANNELATSLITVLLLRLEYVILERGVKMCDQGGTRIFHSRIGPERSH